MAAKITQDREYKRPEPKALDKHGQRPGGPSMKAPGRGGVRKAPLNEAQADQSAANYGDAMAAVGGPADPVERPDRE
jgi:hypothetical protein